MEVLLNAIRPHGPAGDVRCRVPSCRPLVLLALLTGLLTGLVTGLLAAAPSAGAADGDNPLAARPWGVYQGPAELAWPPYEQATGARKRTLGEIALRPKAKWFGAWIPDDEIAAKVHEYVTNAQDGDRSALVQLTIFRMVPWEHEACDRLPDRARSAARTDLDRPLRPRPGRHPGRGRAPARRAVRPLRPRRFGDPLEADRLLRPEATPRCRAPASTSTPVPPTGPRPARAASRRR